MRKAAFIILVIAVGLTACRQQPPLGSANAIYLHHSTGGIVWDGGVPEGLAAYNVENGTDYTITTLQFPYGHGNNPMTGGTSGWSTPVPLRGRARTPLRCSPRPTM